jgi:hypothetical protein
MLSNVVGLRMAHDFGAVVWFGRVHPLVVCEAFLHRPSAELTSAASRCCAFNQRRALHLLEHATLQEQRRDW